MTTIAAMMIISCLSALLLTPLVRRFALKLDLVDLPDRRKMHVRPIPRGGGVAIFLAFYVSFIPLLFPQIVAKSEILMLLHFDPRIIYLMIGSCVAFGLGLFDDRRGLGPTIKFGVQAVAAAIAFYGGIRIEMIQVPGWGVISFGWFSLPITMFWVILVINAINLIDGLDGLAAGISFCVCMVLLIYCLMNGSYLTAVLLASLCGSLLGFLRYNFNPASIFMGDSGSYFIGYMLATFSIIGSIKSNAIVAITIPVIALGVPLFDTMWSTIRRFVIGKNMFKPDKNHFHHKLIRKGYSHRRAVLILYGVTIAMGTVALILVNLRNDRAGLYFLCVAIVPIFGIRRLGYLDYLELNSMMLWLRDWTDETGISKDRRKFLNHLVEIHKSKSVESMWGVVNDSLDELGFDMASLYLNNGGAYNPGDSDEEELVCKRTMPTAFATVSMRKSGPDLFWKKEGFNPSGVGHSRSILRLEMPLMLNDGNNFGTILLQRDVRQSPMSHLTLKRIEHLRRAVVRRLEKNDMTGVRKAPMELRNDLLAN